jgi:O-antigen/teichoic acid export membrane protein
MVSLKPRILSILRWSERYTKTDMVYLASGGLLSLVSQVTALAGALALAIMVSHYVPKTSYGEYKYILSIVALLSSFSLNGIGGAVLQSAAQGFDSSLQKGFWANLRWSFVIFIGALVMALYYFWMGNATLAAEILIGGSLSPFLASASLFSPFLAGKKDFVHQTLFSIGDNLIPIGLMIGTVMLTSSPLALVAVYFVSNTAAALFFYRRTQIRYAERAREHDDSMLGYSKHLSIMGILGGIAENIDQILLFHYVGVVELAVYNFAIALPNQMRTPIKNIDAMLQARYVNRTAREIQSGIRNKIFWYLISTVTLAAAYFCIAPYLFTFLFPQYLESVRYSQIYILWIIALAFDPINSYISSRKHIKALYASTIVYSLSKIALLFVGVLYWGLMGVIVARVATQFIAVVFNYTLYRRVLVSDRSAA